MGWNSYFDAPLLTALLNAQGIPPVDRATILYDAVDVVPQGTTLDTTNIDASGYATLTIIISEVNGAAGSYLVPRVVTVQYYQDAALNYLMTTDVYSYWPSGGGLVLSPLPTRGPFVVVHSSAVAGGAANATISTMIFGSVRTSFLQRAEFTNSNTGAGKTSALATGHGGLWQAGGNFAVGTSLEYPDTYAGAAFLGWNVGAVTTAGSISIKDAATNLEIAGVTLPVLAGGQRGQTEIQIPLRPIVFVMTNANAAALYGEYALTMPGAL